MHVRILKRDFSKAEIKNLFNLLATKGSRFRFKIEAESACS